MIKEADANDAGLKTSTMMGFWQILYAASNQIYEDFVKKEFCLFNPVN
jgi:hypothetical protein